MGFKSGDNGVKAQLKLRYPHAFKSFRSLSEARRSIPHKGPDGSPVETMRSQTSVALDGNVLMMQIPQGCGTFAEYVTLVSSAIRQAMGAAALVVVVFDEPECLTEAKREEQARRDAGRKKREPLCSEDFEPHPTTDDYSLAQLEALNDCHPVVGCRAARLRFFDAVGVAVVRNLQRTIGAWDKSGFQSVLLFDGLDSRGADRPLGEERLRGVWGTDDEVAALFAHRPVGEGDMKLAVVENRLRVLAVDAFESLKLHITCTIDTDSFAIELLECARRNEAAPELNEVTGVFAMRERAPANAWDDEKHATYLVCDYRSVYDALQAELWGRSREPSLHQQRCAMALVVAGWALAGCDYAEVKGLRADFVFEAVGPIVRNYPEMAQAMSAAWSGDRVATLDMVYTLRRIVLMCAAAYGERKGARKAAIADMQNVDEAPLQRAAWTIAYWCGVEHKENLEDFSFVSPNRVYWG